MGIGWGTGPVPLPGDPVDWTRRRSVRVPAPTGGRHRRRAGHPDYLDRTAEQHGIDEHIRYGHKVLSVDFRREEARWYVEVELTDTGERTTLTANWLVSAAGYYSYESGYRPTFPGEDDFTGTLVHPQQWPEDLDLTDQRIVVIGSGATAVTLVPAMADDAAHVTMLQRSPTYIIPLLRKDPLANLVHRVAGHERGHAFARATTSSSSAWSTSWQNLSSVTRRSIRG